MLVAREVLSRGLDTLRMVDLKSLNYRRETEGQNLLAHLPENIRNASADNLMEGLTTISSLDLTW